MLWIKQSTIVTFQLGPFVDITDGVTPEVGLATNMDNATTGIRVSKNGATMIDRNSATAPAHDDDGYYRVALSATDTNTLGTLHVQYEELAITLPAWKDFMVVPANVWDSLFGADNLQIDQVQIAGGTVPAPTTTGVPDVNVERIADVIASITSGDLDVNIATIAADAVSAAALAAAAVNKIARAIGIQTNTAFSDIEFLMVLTSDHVSPATGLTVTGERSIDAGVFAGVAGTITEVSDGIYQFDALAADLNGSIITFRFSSATADDTFLTIKTVV